MTVRGKFKLMESTQFDYSKDARRLKFSAVYSNDTPENERFHKATPSGEIVMTVDNPSAASQFEVGKYYYVDFSNAE